MNPPDQILLSGGFDDIRSRHLRLLEESAKLGEVTVLLWSDELLHERTGREPTLPMAERLYFLNAIRYVSRVIPSATGLPPDGLSRPVSISPKFWIEDEANANDAHRRYCHRHGIGYRVLPAEQLAGFPEPPPMPSPSGRKKIVVTGCYDWFHTGHVRFTEEVSAYGDLYVIVGHDANIRLLKGEGHPLFSQEERRYMVGSVKYVKQALISSGHGWLDADPEIRMLKPDIYAVNEDGAKGGKKEYCERMGLEYRVLKRTPAPGLPRRSSTGLRGF